MQSTKNTNAKYIRSIQGSAFTLLTCIDNIREFDQILNFACVFVKLLKVFFRLFEHDIVEARERRDWSVKAFVTVLTFECDKYISCN